MLKNHFVFLVLLIINTHAINLEGDCYGGDLKALNYFIWGDELEKLKERLKDESNEEDKTRLKSMYPCPKCFIQDNGDDADPTIIYGDALPPYEEMPRYEYGNEHYRHCPAMPGLRITSQSFIETIHV